jgi:hypothetical protein
MGLNYLPRANCSPNFNFHIVQWHFMNSMQILYTPSSVFIYVTTWSKLRLVGIDSKFWVKKCIEHRFLKPHTSTVLNFLFVIWRQEGMYDCSFIRQLSNSVPTRAVLGQHILKNFYVIFSNRASMSSSFYPASTCTFRDLFCPAPIPQNANLLRYCLIVTRHCTLRIFLRNSLRHFLRENCCTEVSQMNNFCQHSISFWTLYLTTFWTVFIRISRTTKC